MKLTVWVLALSCPNTGLEMSALFDTLLLVFETSATLSSSGLPELSADVKSHNSALSA